MANPASPKKQPFPLIQAVITAALALAYFVLRLYWSRYRYIMVDETEHLHAAWSMAQGQMIYRDFFEHHGPVIYWLLQPVVRTFHDPISALYAGRIEMLVVWLIVFCLYLAVGKKEWGWRERALSGFVFCSFSTFAWHAYEVRPDMPAAVMLGALFWLGIRPPSRGRLLAMGFCFTLGLLSSPKLIFPGGGLLLGYLYQWFWLPRKPWREWLSSAALLMAGGALPPAATVWWFWRAHALADFIHWFLWFNSHINQGPMAHWLYVIGSFKENILFWGLAVWGGYEHRKDGPLAFALAGALLGYLVIKPMMLDAYCVETGPIMAYFVSLQLISLSGGRLQSGWKENKLVWIILLLGFARSYLVQIRGVVRDDFQVDQIRCVQTHTKPGDKILSFWNWDAVYRPHASFYCWLCPDIEMTFGFSKVEKWMLDALSDPACVGVIWQDNFLDYHPVLEAYIRQHFALSCGRLWLRKPPP